MALLGGGRLHHAAHHEHGRRHIGRHHVVAQRDAAGDLDVDQLVTVAALRGECREQGAAALHPLLAAVRIRDPQLGQAAVQAREMLIETEQLAFVGRHDFVDAVTENEAPVEHRDLRVAQRAVLAVQVAQGVGKRLHGVTPGTEANKSSKTTT